MSCVTFKKFMAMICVVAMVGMTVPAIAAPPATPATATLTGTVFGESATAPLVGATIVVTDANGAKFTSQPTPASGAFTVAGVAAGRQSLAIETKDGSYAIATPITLAPGETRGVHLALKASSGDDKDKRKKSGTAWTSGAKAAMIAVIVGFVAAGALAIDSASNGTKEPASPYVPPEK